MSAQGLWSNTPLTVLARTAHGRARGSELTDLIDASEPESCSVCGRAPVQGCECDGAESARLLASSF